jgi:hypothetical protein
MKLRFTKGMPSELVNSVSDYEIHRKSLKSSTLHKSIAKYWSSCEQIEVSQEERETGLRDRIKVYGSNIEEVRLENESTYSENWTTREGDAIGSSSAHISYEMKIPKRVAIFMAKKQRSGWEGYILAKVLNNDTTLNKLLKSGIATPKVEVKGGNIRVHSGLGYRITKPSKTFLQAVDLIAGYARKIGEKLEELPTASNEREIPSRYWNDILTYVIGNNPR